MFLRGVARLAATSAVVCVGVGAVVLEKAVSEHGPKVVTGPAGEALAYLRPVSDAIGARVTTWLGEPAAPPAPAGPARPETGPITASGAPDARPDAAPEIRPEPRAAERYALRCSSPDTPADVVVAGDRLHLRIFERSTLAAGLSQTSEGDPEVQDILFERLDLSGSYEVTGSGAVSLPAIGHVDVVGRSLTCVEDLVTQAAAERLRLRGTVSAAFTSRPPVLVRGAVRAPGAHAYSPGLTVERVLAQAGTAETFAPASPLQLASLRTRHDELSALAASLLIERVRLEAALNEDTVFAADPAAWEAVADVLGADRIESEREVLLAEIASQKAQDSGLSDRIDDLVTRLEAAQAHLKTAQAHADYLSQRHEKVGALLEEGIATDAKLEEAAVRKMDMERVVMERRDALLRIEAELRLAHNEQTIREADRQHRLLAALRDTTKERAATREQIRAVRAQLDAYEAETPDVFLITIERPEPEGTRRIEATPDTAVRPGDLVTVRHGAEAGGAPREVPVSERSAGADIRLLKVSAE